MKKSDKVVPESKIQKKGMEAYKKAGFRVTRMRQTNRSGEPDVFLAHKDFPNCHIEYKKSKGGILDPLQKFQIQELRRLGFHAYASASPTLHECEKDIICHQQCDKCKSKPSTIPEHLRLG